MARSTPGVTRQRLIDEARRLFAANGYAATSVADIQQACGLTAGSGALYKHFSSKKALLEEIVRLHVAGIGQGREELVLPEDPMAALRAVGQTIWTAMEAETDQLRIILRDLEQFPDLMEQMWQGVAGELYEGFAAWIRMGNEQGALTVTDPDATSAVLLASLTYYRILGALIGKAPGDVGERDFLAAWVDHAAVSLGMR